MGYGPMSLYNKKVCAGAVVALVVATGLDLVVEAGAAQEGWRENQRNEEAALRYLRPALVRSGGVARIYYRSVCFKNGQALPFPKLAVRPATNKNASLEAVRQVFANSKDVSVRQDQSGMIRITIDRQAQDILQTRIQSLRLNGDEQYNPDLAIAAILTADEVQVAMQRLGWDLPVVVTDMGITEPAEGFAHVPPTLNKLTVDEALDLVAKTFHGIVYYATCANAKPTEKRLVVAGFLGVLPAYETQAKSHK